MAGRNTISLTFVMDGDTKGFKVLAKDAEGLKKVMASTVSEAEQLKGSVINFAALATGLDAAQRSFSQLQYGMKSLADAYAVQEMAETKLTTVMMQRMNATEAEIQSIKNLASEQQKLGVIGDEVQLSGAQQIATFLTEKDSLETLIPAMNNLLAQQKGLNATTQDAVTIGNLMGKVMQGQTSALTRVGITFTDAEAAVLKFGTEQERAAMLAQIITNNVGEMNAKLAETDSGKQQQLVNALGDVKEKLGSLVTGALPFVTIAAQSTAALTSIITLANGVKTLSATLYASAKAFAVSTVAVIKNKTAALAAATAQKAAAAATAAWNVVQKVLNTSLRANPIGLVVTAIGALVTGLIAAYNRSEDFRNICDRVWSAIKPLTKAIMEGLAKAFEWLAEKCRVAWNWLRNILGLSGKKVEVAVDVKTGNAQAPAVDLDATKNKYSNQPAAGKGGSNKELEEITKSLKDLDSQMQNATESESAMMGQISEDVEGNTDVINSQTAAWENQADVIESVGDAAEEAADKMSFGQAWSGVRRIGDSVEGLTESLQGNDNAWQKVTGVISSAIGLYEGINAIISIVRALTSVTNEHAVATTAEGAATIATTTAETVAAGTSEATAAAMEPIIAANKSVTASYMELAASAFFAAHAYIPFAGFGIAAGFVTAATAIVTAIAATPFADGGVVSGPTYALVGEYAGASNNPEVIAPLDKLRNMIDTGNGYGGEVEFKIKGRNLVGVLNKEYNKSNRS